MPLPGPAPKPDGQARHRIKSPHDWIEVENVPFEGGPDLPDFRADGRQWTERIRSKWDAWRSMPHAKLWGPSEWDFALDAIELAALLHEKGASNLATELRNREKVLGTTVDFLRSLRIRYTVPKDVNDGDAAAGVTNLADYRNL